MERTIQSLYAIKPLLFAFGFLTPVLDQALERAGWIVPGHTSNLALSAGLCGAWGLVAAVRGRWL